MMKLTRTGMVVAVFLAGCATGGAASQFAVQDAGAYDDPIPSTASKGQHRWQHHCFVEAGMDDVNEILNDLGAKGWELVSGSGGAYCLKRPK